MQDLTVIYNLDDVTYNINGDLMTAQYIDDESNEQITKTATLTKANITEISALLKTDNHFRLMQVSKKIAGI